MEINGIFLHLECVFKIGDRFSHEPAIFFHLWTFILALTKNVRIVMPMTQTHWCPDCDGAQFFAHDGFWFCANTGCRNFWDPNEEDDMGELNELEQSIKEVSEAVRGISISIEHGIWRVAREHSQSACYGRTLADALKALEAAVAHEEAVAAKYAQQKVAA